jgi:glucose/arabinose dehydrogenase
LRHGCIALVVLLLLFAVACSSSGTDEPEGAPSPPSTSEGSETGPTGPEPTETEEEQPAAPGPPADGGPLELEKVASGLDSPVHAAAAPGEPDRLYVVEQPGRIRVLERGRVQAVPFLDIVSDVSSGGERGLLSVAFHPRYASNGLFYVNYTDLEGDTRVKEFRSRGGVSQPTEVRELFFVSQPYPNHNGGQLAFGSDGLLYLGTGDGGSGGDPENRAQDLSSRLGKLFRRDVDAPGGEWEMIGYGLRNPWRFSFDRVTGDLWIADVGQNAVEEVNFVSRKDVGKLFNFGWDVYEGSEIFEDKSPTPNGTLVGPVSEYSHEFGCSVTGGFVYRGEVVRRQAWGRYFYGDYCSGRIWSLARLGKGEFTRRGHPFSVPGLTSFAEDGNGELYLLSAEGAAYRLVPRP